MPDSGGWVVEYCASTFTVCVGIQFLKLLSVAGRPGTLHWPGPRWGTLDSEWV